MKRHLCAIVALLVFQSGCEDDLSLDEYLEVTLLSGTVQVDVDCDNGGCEVLPSVLFSLRLDADEALPDNDELSFLQFRVDYTISGEAIPFFAGPMKMTLHDGDEQTVTLQAAGTRQRKALDTLDDDILSGTARITLAGYNEKDERIDYSFGFPVQFGDFVDETVAAEGEEK